MKKTPAVFLDRDGTVNHEKSYLSDEKDLKLYSCVAKSILSLQKAGFKIVIITNQSGIERGYFTEKKLAVIHKTLLKMLNNIGVKIDGIYYCPHGSDDVCECRKPKIGMAKQAEKELNIDLKKSYVVGDSVRDYKMGYNFGGKGILVLTGHGKKQVQKIKNEEQKPLAISKNLYEAVKVIINDYKKN